MTTAAVSLRPARDPWLDNAKAVLIVCVVVGHFIVSGFHTSLLAAALSNFLYSFHMPAFLMLSGYLMKRRVAERDNASIVNKTVLPYCGAEILIFVVALLLPDGEKALSTEFLTDVPFFSFLYPIYHLWYFMALVLGYLFLRLTRADRHPVPALAVSLAVSVACGYFPNLEFLRLTKCLGYLPFLVFGAVLPNRRLEAIKGNRVLRFASPVILAAYAAFWWSVRSLGTLTPIFAMTMKYRGYPKLIPGMPAYLGPLVRLGAIALGIAVSLCVLSVCPRRRVFFTYVGERSLYVFVLHVLVVAAIRQIIYSYGTFDVITKSYPLLVVFAVAVVVLPIFGFASKPVCWLFHWVLEPPLDVRRVFGAPPKKKPSEKPDETPVAK